MPRRKRITIKRDAWRDVRGTAEGLVGVYREDDGRDRSQGRRVGEG
jgi:hypothetical protein